MAAKNRWEREETTKGDVQEGFGEAEFYIGESGVYALATSVSSQQWGWGCKV